MLWGGYSSNLEVRARARGGISLRGRFPYNTAAVLSDGGRGGRPKKERIGSRAFAYRVNKADEDIHFLVGHSFDRPLASRGAGSLDLTDTDDALLFEATISADMQEVSYARDFLAGLAAGLVAGVSPGFRLPPKRAVAMAETVEDEGSDPVKGEHGAIIRTVHEALLYELSAVTRPAYPDTQIEERSWEVAAPAGRGQVIRQLAWRRWRA